ncbi:MBL fold metallo-hydrolase [Jatrophihabitans telluris]|uniref:MBL fold metallo-hydrolase n=1 Tax=Jatrophihabitans telluris TaxID=2038343 RepID=A0ABY4R2L1_9ACTN|nr:MBL fold metallo-hydrolase [Jatrophihabitans telluris]UQX89653.1 MBL fold metallo-hydrolase [Jatrophihabitans telluris]
MRELAAGVYVCSHESFALNTGLVVGTERALVIDSRASAAQGRQWLAEIRTVTSLPLVVVNTHAHLDHFFGNIAFAEDDPEVEIWAHRSGLAEMVSSGEDQREFWAGEAVRAGRPELAAELAETELIMPNRVTDLAQRIELGGRGVWLSHLGAGHTDHDLVIDLPGVVFAGDLVEQGSPPAFEDGYPLQWPDAVSALLQLGRPLIVPGHGDVVHEAFVRAQRDQLGRVAEVVRLRLAGHPKADELDYVGWPASTLDTAFGRPLSAP